MRSVEYQKTFFGNEWHPLTIQKLALSYNQEGKRRRGQANIEFKKWLAILSSASFCLFSLFSSNLQIKTVDLREIRTVIVGVEGEQAGHLTTTTAQMATLSLEI